MTMAELKKRDLLKVKKNYDKSIELTGRSIYIFTPENWLRQNLKKVLEYKHYDKIIMFFICVSSISLAFDNPLNDPASKLRKILQNFDIILTVIFAFECLINIIVYGMIFNGPSSYLRNSWNIMDFAIVIVSTITFTLNHANNKKMSITKIFRLLRVLRPLRMLKR